MPFQIERIDLREVLASLANFTLPGDLSLSRRYRERDLVDPEGALTTV